MPLFYTLLIKQQKPAIHQTRGDMQLGSKSQPQEGQIVRSSYMHRRARILSSKSWRERREILWETSAWKWRALFRPPKPLYWVQTIASRSIQRLFHLELRGSCPPGRVLYSPHATYILSLLGLHSCPKNIHISSLLASIHWLAAAWPIEICMWVWWGGSSWCGGPST